MVSPWNAKRACVQEAERRKCPVTLVTFNAPHKKANAAVLLGTWLVLFCGMTAAAAYERLRVLEPFQPFRDASCGVSQFHLTVKHVLQVRVACSPFGQHK
jgi:cell division cycle 14